MDSNDVGVVQFCDRLGLAQQALSALRAEVLIRHHLDRDVAIERSVMGAIDDTHPALAELIAELVAVV